MLGAAGGEEGELTGTQLRFSAQHHRLIEGAEVGPAVEPQTEESAQAFGEYFKAHGQPGRGGHRAMQPSGREFERDALAAQIARIGVQAAPLRDGMEYSREFNGARRRGRILPGKKQQPKGDQ